MSDASLILESGTSLAEEEHSSEKVPSSLHSKNIDSCSSSLSELRQTLADGVVGGHTKFQSPLHQVPLVYCDQTASNKSVTSIEEYLTNECLPLYGNTHTNISITGSQSTAFVAEARQIVAEATNAKITGKAATDVVLFAGNGTTSAVELLIDCLGIKHVASDKRPVVFIGPYEHHSNLLPWRESGCEICMVPESSTGQVDLTCLEQLLQKFPGRIKMGTFSAASNVTGKVCNVDQIAALLHKYEALAFFDYATGAPYMTINMNMPQAKDAIMLSGHKMLGGVGTPGILIIKKSLVQQLNPPRFSGGGTVFYVSQNHHRFLSNRIERYEGGTPNVVGCMRIGLSFLLKRQVEQRYALLQQEHKELPPTLLEYEFQTYDTITKTLKQHAPNLIVLDSHRTAQDHLPIFSFLVKCGTRFLHYNYVCAILNDVFGIQSRGGCQCAGPYSQRLLGLTEMDVNGQEIASATNQKVEHALLHYKEKAELLRPGYTRLSLPFKGLTQEHVDYVVKALEWVAKHGWKLMCQYRCNHRTGEWRHFSRQGKPLGRTERKWLSHYNMQGKQMESFDKIDNLSDTLEQTLNNANGLLNHTGIHISQALNMVDAESVLGKDEEELEQLRWYVYPKECAQWLSDGFVNVPGTMDNANVQGAIRPIALFDQSAKPSGDDETSEKTFANGSGHEEASDADDQAMEDNSVPLFFRDGEHSGEAPVEDIEAGFNDGELSKACEIFSKQQDGWVPIADFFQSRKKVKTEEDGSSAPATATPMETSQEMQNGEEPLGPSLTDALNQRKKPSRDSSSWGQPSNLDIPRAANSGNTEDEQIENVDNVNIETLLPSAPSGKRGKRGRGIKPPPKMMRQITQAMIQWNMVEEGDRLLLGLSGGKDSMSLLHCLLEFQRKLPTNFSIEVCTIDPMTPSFDPSPLIPYVQSLGLKYHYIRDDIVSRASSSGKGGKAVTSLCAFCARMKRGNLYTCARKNNCNKLVLAQHLDDCAESFLMSVMHNGFLRTMKANYRINAGDISVIRPMVYCRESLMTEFARSANLPVINENCPACFEEPKERARVKKLLSREETLYPNIYEKIRHSLIPLMHDDATAIMRCYTEEAVSKSRKNKKPDKTKSKVASVEANETNSASIGPSKLLHEASEEDLMLELARRKAERFRLSGAMGRLEESGGDPTGQVCTLNGGNGSIPCRELME